MIAPSLRAVRALLALNYGISLQYRAQSVLWMINGTVPLIMMLIWLQLAQGGAIVGNFREHVGFVSVAVARKIHRQQHAARRTGQFRGGG